jgi:hypothetical protein
VAGRDERARDVHAERRLAADQQDSHGGVSLNHAMQVVLVLVLVLDANGRARARARARARGMIVRPMATFQEIRTLATSLAKGAGRAALARAPGPLRDAVESVQARYETKKLDAQRALEELAALEEQAFEIAVKIMLFPWATAGAIRELYGKVRELERTVESRDEAIKRLEARIRDLERRAP